MNIKKNDTVIVISGDEKGTKGKVLKVFPEDRKIIVEKVNFVKRHLKKGHPQAQQGGIIEKESPINVTKVMLFCVSCSKPTRVGHKILASSEKVRVCKKCNEVIESK